MKIIAENIIIDQVFICGKTCHHSNPKAKIKIVIRIEIRSERLFGFPE